MKTCGHHDCPAVPTQRLAVWMEDASRVTDYFVHVCDDHAMLLLASGNAAALPIGGPR